MTVFGDSNKITTQFSLSLSLPVSMNEYTTLEYGRQPIPGGISMHACRHVSVLLAD